MERPSPHPGHQTIPRLSNGHKPECTDPETVKAKNKIALIHTINSNGRVVNKPRNRFLFIK